MALSALASAVILPWLLDNIGSIIEQNTPQSVYQLIVKGVGLLAEHNRCQPACDNSSQKNTKHSLVS